MGLRNTFPNKDDCDPEGGQVTATRVCGRGWSPGCGAVRLQGGGRLPASWLGLPLPSGHRPSPTVNTHPLEPVSAPGLGSCGLHVAGEEGAAPPGAAAAGPWLRPGDSPRRVGSSTPTSHRPGQPEARQGGALSPTSSGKPGPAPRGLVPSGRPTLSRSPTAGLPHSRDRGVGGCPGPSLPFTADETASREGTKCPHTSRA